MPSVFFLSLFIDRFCIESEIMENMTNLHMSIAIGSVHDAIFT